MGLMSVTADAVDVKEPTYRISISGPTSSLDGSCDDPCHLERVGIVGELGMRSRKEEVISGRGEGEADTGVECYGECKQKRTQLWVSTPRTLKEGVELTIEDRWAHFIFYSVVETDSGPRTRRRHHEFRVDRPLIAVSLDEHDVEIQAMVEQDPDVVRKRTLIR
jgi:hypothetical protein